MVWKKVSPELREQLEKHMLSFDCQRKFMFGSPTYFINNNMFAGIHQDTIMLRLSQKDREEILANYDEVAPFEPIEGRIMREYVALPESIYNDTDTLHEFLNRSYQYTLSLPPKEPGPRTRRKKRLR